MNPTYHRPVEVELVPTDFSHSLKHAKNVFTLRMRYRPDGSFHSHRLVYIPESLQPALLSGDVEGIHLETFNYGSRAHRHLPYALGPVVLGVKTKSGVEISEVPEGLKRGWRLDLGTGLTACLVGVALFATLNAWLGALLLLFGSHRLRDAFEIPRKPFWTSREVFSD